MKVGILTHYYNSLNYGGNLQAYAFCRFLNRSGLDSEQVCYLLLGKRMKEKSPNKRIRGELYLLKKHAQKFFYTLLYYKRCRQYRATIEERRRKISYFSKELILHSKEVYSDKNLTDVVKNMTPLLLEVIR